MYDLLIAPFENYYFMRRALVACIALSFGFAPVGIILVLRRMSLVGDSMSHAVLPGAAIGFLVSGTSLISMTIGGIVAGVVVAVLSTFVTRSTGQKEDASFASFYIVSLALGVIIISLKGTNIDLIHILFGTILAVDNEALILVTAISTVTVILISIFYRGFIVELLDPDFLKVAGFKGYIYHYLALILVVLNLVSGFRALGTLMAVGLMLLPVLSARFWVLTIGKMVALSVAIGCFTSYLGLLISYYNDIPSGPAIVMVCAAIYIFSMVFGSKESLRKKYFPGSHLEA